MNKSHPLKLERERRNLSQKALADFLVVNEKTIRRAERGEAISADSRSRICDYFGKTSQELGLVVEKTIEESNSLQSIDRRQMLKYLGATGTSVLLNPQSLLGNEPWMQLSSAMTKAANINSSTLYHLDSITKNYWQIRSAFTNHDMYNILVSHLQTLTRLLQNTLSPNLRKELCTIAGKAALFVGQTAFDIHEYSAAHEYYKVALQAGQEAEDYNLQSVALGRMGFQLIYDKQPQKALAFMEMANSVPRQEMTAITFAWLNLVEAEAQALTKNSSSCLRLLESAERVIGDQSYLHESDPFWTGLDNSMLNGYKGACYLHLHQPKEALGILQNSLANVSSVSTRRRSIILTDIAEAYTQQGEVEEACRVINEALLLCNQTKSIMVLERISKVRQELAPWNGAKVVNALDEQLLMAL